MVVSHWERGRGRVCEGINVGKGLVFYEMDNLLDYRNVNVRGVYSTT